MTTRRWIAFASAAAMIAGVGACKDNTGGSAAGTRPSAEPQGRRSDTLPRARDAGADMSGTSGSAAGSTSPSQDTAGSASGSASGSSSDTTKK
jgi:hypothetical protein